MSTSASPWTVISIGQAAAAPTTPPTQAQPTTSAQSAASAQTDPWAVTQVDSAPVTAAKPTSSNFGDWAEKTFNGTPEEQAQGYGSGTLTGFVKSAGQLAGTVLDLISKPKAPVQFEVGYKADHPNANPDEIQQAYSDEHGKTWGGRMSKHMQDAAQWLRSGSQPEGFEENLGAIGEQLLEYVGTDGLLKMVGTGARVTAGAGRAAETAEHLKNAQQVATTLQKNPKLAGLVAIGVKAARDASMMAGQTYLHTEDPEQAAVAGAAGGATSALASGAGAWLRNNAVRKVAIAGEEIPALASQVNKAGKAIDTGALGAPGVAEAQQQGAQAVIRNTAARATASALAKINETRPVFQTMEDATRMLPAGADAEPFKFKLEGPGAVERTEGEIAQPAAKAPSLPNRQVFTSESAPAVAEGTAPRNRGTMGADLTTENVRPTSQRQAAADVVGGGGNLETADPREAESWLRQIEDLQSTPEHNRLPQAQQDAIEAQRKALQDQLGIYHSSPYAQRFGQIDVAGAANGVQTFGDAADQVEAAAKPVYETLDRVSNGQFNSWKEIAKRNLKLMRNPSSEEAFQNAQAKYQEATGEINDLIDRHRGEVSNTDYMTAKGAWRDSSRLNELHSVFEGMMNGVTAEESEQGFTRVMTGRAKTLERYLSQGTNREQIEQLIGKDGTSNLKQITLLLSKANTARTTQNVARESYAELARHVGRAGTGALFGAAVGRALGYSPYEGAVAGAIAADGIRYVLRQAVTNPRVGNMVDYAVRNGLSPKQYAPLIARVLAEPFETQKDNGEGK